MPLKDHITRPILPEGYYHVYNRGNIENDIFFTEENYRYFLMKYKQYMLDYWDTYAYALLSNHFHLAIRVKSKTDILVAAERDLKRLRKDKWEQLLRKVQLAAGDDSRASHEGDLTVFKKLLNLAKANLASPPMLNQLIPLLTPDLRIELAAWAVSERFRRFMLGYSKAINKQQKPRYGSLFQKPFRRKPVEGALGLQRLIAYIHRNGVHHGYVKKLEDYPHSSYHAILSSSQTSLARKQVLGLYGGIEQFLHFHGTMPPGGFMDEKFVIEE